MWQQHMTRAGCSSPAVMVHFTQQLQVKNERNNCLRAPTHFTEQLPAAVFYFGLCFAQPPHFFFSLNQNIRMLYNGTEQTLSQVLLPALTLCFQTADHFPGKMQWDGVFQLSAWCTLAEKRGWVTERCCAFTAHVKGSRTQGVVVLADTSVPCCVPLSFPHPRTLVYCKDSQRPLTLVCVNLPAIRTFPLTAKTGAKIHLSLVSPSLLPACFFSPWCYRSLLSYFC